MRGIETANAGEHNGVYGVYGVCGDAQWTNKERLSDETLRNVIEHFSKYTLSLTNVPEDELCQAYEFLIKKFADDSGHTAAEFYTNRTVIHLMTLLLEPQPGECAYDPTRSTRPRWPEFASQDSATLSPEYERNEIRSSSVEHLTFFRGSSHPFRSAKSSFMDFSALFRFFRTFLQRGARG